MEYIKVPATVNMHSLAAVRIFYKMFSNYDGCAEPSESAIGKNLEQVLKEAY